MLNNLLDKSFHYIFKVLFTNFHSRRIAMWQLSGTKVNEGKIAAEGRFSKSENARKYTKRNNWYEEIEERMVK